MFWLTRPPYVRWAAAALLIVAAFIWDLRGRTGTPYPFAAVPIAAGATIGEGDVDWRSVPGGLMPLPDLSTPVAGRDIERGEPILPSAIDPEGGVPAGWWAVPVALPAAAAVGSRVLLLSVEQDFEADGIVIATGSGDLLSVSETGLVAVPPEAATMVARAAFDGRLIVLVAPRAGGDSP